MPQSFGALEKAHKSKLRKKTVDDYGRLCISLNIKLTSISTEELKAVSAQDSKCGICHQSLIPYDEYKQSCMKRLPRTENLEELGTDFEDTEGIAEKMVQKAMVHTRFDLEDSVLKGMRNFADTLFQAYERLKKLKEHIPVACTYAVKTECGHLFGKCCLFPWIDVKRGETACPYCRAELAERPRDGRMPLQDSIMAPLRAQAAIVARPGHMSNSDSTPTSIDLFSDDDLPSLVHDNVSSDDEFPPLVNENVIIYQSFD